MRKRNIISFMQETWECSQVLDGKDCKECEICPVWEQGEAVKDGYMSYI